MSTVGELGSLGYIAYDSQRVRTYDSQRVRTPVALHIDLDQAKVDFGKSILHFTTDLLRLHVFIQAFPYDYDCNCDMLKYLNLLNKLFL